MMIGIIPNENSSRNNNSIRRRPIESISLVPTEGDASSTTVLVDVNAKTRTAIAELKGIQGYSSQFFVPMEMILGNDLIKVWNIDDERQVEDSIDITLKEEEAFFTLSFAAPFTQIEKRKENTMIMEVMNSRIKPSLSSPPVRSFPTTTETVVLDNNNFDVSAEDTQMESTTSDRENRRGHRRYYVIFDFTFQ